MLPKICSIGPLTIYSYGLMMAISVITCFLFLKKDARAVGISSDVISDFVFWTLIFGLLGGRIFYVVLNLDFFLGNPWEIIMIQHGGLAWQGGFLFGLLAAIFFVKKQSLSFFQIADLSAPYLALGEAIGRIGCFLNGCCYGQEFSKGIYFPVYHAYLYPTQLYSFGGLLICFFILKKFQSVKKVEGQTFALYLILGSIVRFIVQFYRADYQPIIFGLGIFQVICLLMFVAGMFLYWFLLKKQKS